MQVKHWCAICGLLFFSFIQNDLRKTTTKAMHTTKWHNTKYQNCSKNYKRKEQSEKSTESGPHRGIVCFLKVERDSFWWSWEDCYTTEVQWMWRFGKVILSLLYAPHKFADVCGGRGTDPVTILIRWVEACMWPATGTIGINRVQKRITEPSLFCGLWCSANLSQKVLLGS